MECEMRNSFKKQIILGFKITAVRGSREIILWEQYLPQVRDYFGNPPKIEIPNGYDIVCEAIMKK